MFIFAVLTHWRKHSLDLETAKIEDQPQGKAERPREGVGFGLLVVGGASPFLRSGCRSSTPIFFRGTGQYDFWALLSSPVTAGVFCGNDMDTVTLPPAGFKKKMQEFAKGYGQLRKSLPR